MDHYAQLQRATKITNTRVTSSGCVVIEGTYAISEEESYDFRCQFDSHNRGLYGFSFEGPDTQTKEILENLFNRLFSCY
jgi:hypothetical protein